MLSEEEVTLPVQSKALTILVVEDDEESQVLFTEALSLLTPYHVHVVRTGTEALHFVTQVKPSVFLIDYRLPQMSGIDLYDRLHAIVGLENVPAIIISATTSEQLTRDIKSRNLSRLEKPFDLDVLLETVKQTLKRRT